MTPTLTLAEATRIIREAVKDRAYRATPLGHAQESTTADFYAEFNDADLERELERVQAMRDAAREAE